MPANVWNSVRKKKIACFLIIFFVSLSLSSFTVYAQNPIAKDDQAKVNEDSSVVITVLENDEDVNSDPDDRKITIVETPAHGTAETLSDTEIIYTPAQDYYGSDYFVYRVENLGGGSSEANVTIEVEPQNDPPFPVRDLFTTRENIPVTIKLSATDEDVEPMRPDRHPIEFQLLGEPLHGEISGDIEDVQYETPNRAFVELEYIPDPGFRGIETLNYRVEDERGVGNVSTIIIDVIPEARAPVSFSGYWDSYITLTGEDSDYFSDFGTDLTTIYRYADVEWRTDSSWSKDELDSVKLRGEAPLGLLEFNSLVDFDPTAAEPFNYWRTRTDFEFSEIDFRHTFYLDDDSDNTYYRLEGRWSLGSISFSGRTQFTGANPAYDESRLRSRWRCSDCEVTVNTDVSFTDEGFNELAIDVGDLPLFYGTYFEFETTFTANSKIVEPNIFYRSEWLDCFMLLGEVETNDLENILEGFNLYGIRFRNTFPNGYTLRVDTAIDKDKNSSVTGDSNYSQKFTLSGPFYSGYRSPGRLQMTTYLDSITNDELFGWGKSRLRMITPLSDELDISSDLVLRSESPTFELTLEAEVIW
ncbi:cadherin-like domain-containing protein [Candidatus Bipolaricaulota bacterium]|nr:cadherin-like domain-containing protein [Candidatus Bipolaricaulota bacterium]